MSIFFISLFVRFCDCILIDLCYNVFDICAKGGDDMKKYIPRRPQERIKLAHKGAIGPAVWHCTFHNDPHKTTIAYKTIIIEEKRTCDLQVLFLAPLVGLEPTTCGLTVRRSTDWAKEEYECWHYLSSRAVARQVLSAQMSLTSVFGMGTGGPSSQSIPTHVDGFRHHLCQKPIGS